MKFTRRNFLTITAGVGTLSLLEPPLGRGTEVSDEALEKAAAKPVLQLTKLKEPVIIESIELLRKGREHFLRVRSHDGMIRSIRVARMAELCDLPTTAHLSGGFGFVYSLHFASCTPKIGPWQEYKKGVETYGQWFEPALRI